MDIGIGGFEYPSAAVASEIASAKPGNPGFIGRLVRTRGCRGPLWTFFWLKPAQHQYLIRVYVDSLPAR